MNTNKVGENNMDQLHGASTKPFVRRTILSALVFLASLSALGSSFAQVIGSAQLNTERRGHTATVLQNGKVLIIGGENQNGIVSQAEVLDPASLTSTPVPAAGSARTDHTSTLLPDGRVLISGGRSEAGALASTQVYDPALGSFQPGPSMNRARSGHTATVLADGKILMAGGDGSGSAEIYDPGTQAFSLVPGSLNTPRQLHSAVLLQNGNVLIAGGVEGQNTLNSAEIYNAETQSFSPTAGPMGTARGLALLRLLPDGKVQVIGGDSEFSMEMFDPSNNSFIALAHLPPHDDYLSATLASRTRSALVTTIIAQNPVLQGALTPEVTALLDRLDHSLTEIPQSNRALIAGGVNSIGQILNSATVVTSSAATITTDKLDYAPGETVTITGRGWQPGETVWMLLHEEPETHEDVITSSVADDQGNFTNTNFAPGELDLNRIFTLTAIGQSSGFAAQTAFKDAAPADVNFVTSGLPSGASITVTWNGTNNGGNPTSGSTTFTSPGPSGSTATKPGSLFSFSFPPNVSVSGTTYNLNSTSPTSPLTTGAEKSTTTVTGTYAPACTTPSITTQPTNQTVTYDQNASFTAAANGDPTPSVKWQVSTDNGATWSDVPGATSTTLTVTAPTVAQSGNKYRAVFTNDCGGTQTATTNAVTLTVNKLAITVTADAKSRTYGDPDPALTYQVTSGSLAGGDSFSGALTRDAGEDVGSYAITQGSLALSSNYDLTFVGANLTINKRAVTVTADAKTKVYGDTDPALTYQITSGSLKSGDSFTGALTRVAGETVGQYDILQGTLALNSNYDLTYVGAKLTINKKPASVTPNAASKIYGDPDPAFTGTLSGFLAADGVTAVYSRTAGETVGNYTISATLSPAAGLGNYEITYNSANFTINKKDASVVAGDNGKTYGAADPTLTGTLSGFLAVDNIGATYARAAGENVGTYVITPTLVDPNGKLGNYNVSSTNGTFTINKATLTVTADNKTITYGDPEPAFTFQYSGFKGSDTAAVVDIQPSCSVSGSHTNAGSYPITCSGGLDNNYDFSYVNGTLTVNKATATVTLNGWGTYIYDGTAKWVTATTSPTGLTVNFTYTGTGTTVYSSSIAPTNVGTYEVIATVDDINYQGSAKQPLVINAWTLHGFYQPVDMTPWASATVWNSVKGGSTVPLKFEIFAGSTELTDTSVISLSATTGVCSSGLEVAVDEFSATGGTSLRYDSIAGQFIFNWQTPKKAGVCYKVTMTTKDGSALSAYFKTK